jgi:hypothetical protein
MKPWINCLLQLYKSATGLTLIQEAGSKTGSALQKKKTLRLYKEERAKKKKMRKIYKFLSHSKNSLRISKLCLHSLINGGVVTYSKWQPIKYLSMKGIISTDG